MGRFGLAWVLAVVAACSANATDDDDDDDGVGASAGSGGVAGSGALGGSAGTGGAGASSGGTGGAGGTGTGGSSDKLFPMQVGYEWTYQVQAVGAGSVCAAGQHSSTVIGTSELAGKTAFEITSWCSGVGGTTFHAPGTGDEVFVYYQGQWLTLIDPNLQEGHTWSYYNTSYTWHQEASVTVPAGTFTDCWRAEQNVSYTAYITYCRGVGTVRSYSADLTGAGWGAQLSAKNF